MEAADELLIQANALLLSAKEDLRVLIEAGHEFDPTTLCEIIDRCRDVQNKANRIHIESLADLGRCLNAMDAAKADKRPTLFA